MLEKIKILSNLIEAESFESAEKFRLEYLSKKGKISKLFDDFKSEKGGG